MSSSLNHDYSYAQQQQQQQTPPSQGNTPQEHQQPYSHPPPAPTAQSHSHSQPQPQPEPQPQAQSAAAAAATPSLASVKVAAPPPLPPPSSSQSRSVKRPRPVKSCTECRKRKLRCDRLCPCSQCQKSQRACKYAADNDSSNLSDGSDAEGAGDGLQMRPAKARCIVPTVGVPGGAADGLGTHRNMELSSSAVAAALPLLEDMSDRMERLEKHLMGRSPSEITDTPRGRRYEKSRTKSGSDHQVEMPQATLRSLSSKYGGRRTRYHGPTSTRVLMNLVSACAPPA